MYYGLRHKQLCRKGALDQPAVVVQTDAEVPARREPQVPPGLTLGAQGAFPPRSRVLEPLMPGHVVNDHTTFYSWPVLNPRITSEDRRTQRTVKQASLPLIDLSSPATTPPASATGAG